MYLYHDWAGCLMHHKVDSTSPKITSSPRTVAPNRWGCFLPPFSAIYFPYITPSIALYILYFFLSGMIHTITPGSYWSPQFFSQFLFSAHYYCSPLSIRLFARLSLQSFHWLSSSIFSYCSFGRSSRIRDTSSHLHYMMFPSIQTIYFLWGYDPGNMSVSTYLLLLSWAQFTVV